MADHPPAVTARTTFAKAAAAAARDAGRDRDGKFRSDAVTVAAMLVLARDLHRTGGPDLLRPDHDDRRLAADIDVLLADLSLRFPALLPPGMDRPDPAAVRTLVAPFENVEVVEGRWFVDALDLAFCHAAPMAGKRSDAGSHFTPPAIAGLLAATTGDKVRPWEAPVFEPAVGTGSMLLAVWGRVRTAIREAHAAGDLTYEQARAALRRWAGGVVAVDIDPEAAWCAALQIAVRVGFPARVLVGDALAGPEGWRPAVHPHVPPASPADLAAEQGRVSVGLLAARAQVAARGTAG